MELEFDKEIDSLLRKAEIGVLVGDKPGEKPKIHLDADELSTFAENAMPERTRALHLAHLADCDHCRRILSGLITLNAEAEPVEVRVAAPAISPAAIEPWYRRFLLPNLAYVMGGLVLVFGGLITISLLQSTDREAATVSQSVANTSAARGPMEQGFESQTADMANSNAANTVANRSITSANSVANASSNAANTAPAGTLGEQRNESAPRDDRDAAISTDGVTAAKPAAAAPAPVIQPPAKAEGKEVATTTLPDSSREEDSKARKVAKAKDTEGERSDLAAGARQTQDSARTQAGGVAKSTPGPSREAQQNFPNRANNTYEMYEEKRVSGKSFQHRDNVWYDKAYRGQATTNVRRQTDEYRKLDTGLRSIAESLNGVVVVVWKDKAYRIQ